MNWDQVVGNLKQLEGRVRESWGYLVDDEEEEQAGRMVELDGMLQEHRGMIRDDVERRADLMHAPRNWRP